MTILCMIISFLSIGFCVEWDKLPEYEFCHRPCESVRLHEQP